ILKHTNACGVASRPTIQQAWIDALACDPVSAFGGVLITNGNIDKETAEEINKLFFEVLIAPSYSEEALDILTAKKNRIILRRKSIALSDQQFKILLNGVILQEKDNTIEGPSRMTSVSDVSPTDATLEDLYFASTLVKRTKCTAIVCVKNGTL